MAREKSESKSRDWIRVETKQILSSVPDHEAPHWRPTELLLRFSDEEPAPRTAQQRPSAPSLGPNAVLSLESVRIVVGKPLTAPPGPWRAAQSDAGLRRVHISSGTNDTGPGDRRSKTASHLSLVLDLE